MKKNNIAPHHFKIDDHSPFREGVTLPNRTKAGCTLVDCGLRKLVLINKPIKSNVRVTVCLPSSTSSIHSDQGHIIGEVVSPNAPREEKGLYWGYRVRLAGSLSRVMKGCPWSPDGSYDVKIGISETSDQPVPSSPRDDAMKKPYSHALVVLGGTKGLEYSADCDEEIKETSCQELFDFYVRPVESLGSRIMRSEENVLVSLTALKGLLSNT